MLQDWLRLPKSPDRDPLCAEAKAWVEDWIPKKDLSELQMDQFKQLHEYGQNQLNELDTLHRMGADRSLALLKLDSFLVAGAFTYFRAQEVAMPLAIKIAIGFWTAAMIIATAGFRRSDRPCRTSVRTCCEFIETDDKRFHAWLSMQTHEQIVRFNFRIAREAWLTNASVLLTAIGLATLVLAVALGG